MSLVVAGTIGEMTCAFDVVADALLSVTLTHARLTPPVVVLDAGIVKIRIVGSDRASSTTTLATPIPLTRADMTHPKFPTRRGVLQFPPFTFYERPEI